ncbi:hypothetical protein FA15DRAFT_700389 [Coprinopsis marcescibilis]|uniref:Uncharacterized protein n=1 Tax=Coprinopsis marcescibilis TaxID=230819 RepID=A0A5C3LKC8_COPMA|nr:hypothetical protein FA15DRAFT_700389 [Coprinopsis marcescibilis]
MSKNPQYIYSPVSPDVDSESSTPDIRHEVHLPSFGAVSSEANASDITLVGGRTSRQSPPLPSTFSSAYSRNSTLASQSTLKDEFGDGSSDSLLKPSPLSRGASLSLKIPKSTCNADGSSQLTLIGSHSYTDLEANVKESTSDPLLPPPTPTVRRVARRAGLCAGYCCIILLFTVSCMFLSVMMLSIDSNLDSWSSTGRPVAVGGPPTITDIERM